MPSINYKSFENGYKFNRKELIMVYQKFGIVFKKIREQKRISLSKLSSLGISKSSISRFERGESAISFESVYFSLQLMGVSLEDFETVLNDYSPNEFDYLMEEIEKATINIDKKRLEDLYKLAHEKNLLYISLSAKSKIEVLNELEVEILTDYFFELFFWTYKELCILYLVMENLNTHDILHIVDNFLFENNEILKSGKARSYLVKACCKAVLILSKRGYYDYSKHILNQIDKTKIVDSMFLRNLRNLTYGYWVYSFEDSNHGLSLINSSLDIIASVGTPELLNYFKSQYNEYIDSPHIVKH